MAVVKKIKKNNGVSPNYGYKYPNGLNLHPESEVHKKLLSHLMDYFAYSYESVSGKYEEMREIDDTLNVFIDLSDAQKKIKNADSNEPVKIVVAQTFANLETYLAFMTTLFSPPPVLKYTTGGGGEDLQGVLKLQKVVQRQFEKARGILNMHTWWRDGYAYGRGYMVPRWRVEKGKKVKRHSKLVDGFINIAGVALPTQVEEYLNRRKFVDSVQWEGTELRNTNPYASYPDPNVAAGDIQKGAFFADSDRDNYYNLLMSEQTDETGSRFNVKYINDFETSMTSFAFEAPMALSDRSSALTKDDLSKVVDVHYIQCKLIPDDFGLSSSDYPEIWEFEVAGDSLIIGARRLDNIHGLLNVVENCPTVDGRSVLPISKIATTMGMQVFTNFMLNSRILNSRLVMNSGFLYDPMMINELDLDDPGPGMRVRTTEATWGNRKLSDFLMPLPVTDVTAGNMNDVVALQQMMRDLSGSIDPFQGIRRTGGERVTAEEISGIKQGGASKMGHLAFLVAEQGMKDLAYIYAINTQQYMKQETYVEAIGDWDDVLADEFKKNGKRVKVTPFDLLVDFDVKMENPLTSNNEDKEGLMRMMQMLSNSPMFLQNLKIEPLLRGMIRILGVKNINEMVQFRESPVQTEVQDNRQVQQGVQAGNLVPTQEFQA